MPDPATLLIFIAAAAALLITPGPAVLYIVARSIDQGRLAGLVSVLGINLGTLVHVMAAALGVSALLVSSALAFSVVKYLGAAYLIYLGIRKLRAPAHDPAIRQVPESDSSSMPYQPGASRGLAPVFWQGVVVNLLNPKTALFFFAFLPQFADPARGSVGVQVLVLGLILVSMGVCSDGMYALLAGTLGAWLRRSRGFWRAQRNFAGGVYIVLGVTTALVGSDHH